MIPQQINWRPPSYFGRDDLETLMMSESAGDWVRNFYLFIQLCYVGLYMKELKV